MMAHHSFGSASFRLMAKGLVELHQLIQSGKDDSPDAEAIRDALDVPLRALSQPEKERSQWLSEDLYSVSEPPAPSDPKVTPRQAQQDYLDAYQARQSREWDRALTLLRRSGEYIAPSLLSHVRGEIWSAAGYPQVAAFFYEHASKCEPKNANYLSRYLKEVAEFDPSSAILHAQQVLDQFEDFDPLVVVEAVSVLFQKSRPATDAEAQQECRYLIPILERNLVRINADKEVADRRLEYQMTVSKLGIFYELLGNSGAAVDYFSRGLQVNPNNDALLVARGILQYGMSTHAISDLEKAVELKSQLIWPYLFLAHHYLGSRRFEECRMMCESGIQMQGSVSAKSQLAEWRAISQAVLGFSPDAVRAAFEEALRWDSLNELASRNLQIFEATLTSPLPRSQPHWEQKSEAAVRQFGVAERRYSFAA